MTETDIADALVRAFQKGDGEGVRSFLDPDVTYSFPNVHVGGRDQVAEYLIGNDQPIFREGHWDAAEKADDVIRIFARQDTPPIEKRAVSRSYNGLLLLEFSGDLVRDIKLQVVAREKWDAEPLKLTQPYRDVLDNALDDGAPILLAFMDGDQPRISPRGSLQVFGNTQFAMWIRNYGGNSAFLKAIEENPHVALYHLNMPKARYIEMLGVARLVTDGDTRDKVYDMSPEREREHDFERNGVAVIIDLTSYTGPNFEFPGARTIMKA